MMTDAGHIANAQVVSIVGARPQFVKASEVSRALEQAGIREFLIHTGQHYDPEMSAIFFEALELR
jgi:UDP-N-acetylglucosamine 2-epimerase